jgi:replication-associated recombination protein RarA
VIDILLHPITKRAVDNLARELPQSLLISGEKGVGLLTIAKWLAGPQLAAELHPQDAKEHVDSNGTITVEMIRRLYEQTRAKYTVRQIIVIDDADRMSLGAQSAFLKLLEEPNNQIYFILTSHRPQKLLPTIYSRVQHTVIKPLNTLQSSQFMDTLDILEPIKKTQLEFIAGGLPAELTRLTEDLEYFKIRAAIIGDARDLLQADTYKKMLIVQKYRSNRDDALRLIDSAIHILRRSVSLKPQPALITQLDKLLDVSERIASNQSTQLQLTQFVL